MLLTNKEALIDILNQEITWCRNNQNKSNKGNLFEEGFIEGVKQVRFHIESYYKIKKTVEIENNEIMEE